MCDKEKTYNRPRIVFDMDDVLTDFLGHLLEVYNQRFGTNYKKSDISEWDFMGSLGENAFEIFREDGFFYDLRFKKWSKQILQMLIESTKVDVYIVTACTRPEEYVEKVKYMQKCMPQFNTDRLISCKEKYIINADIIIDDKVENLKKCAPYMKCIVYDMPHNRGCNEFSRIKNLNELIPILEEEFDISFQEDLKAIRKN